jgi:hypothetical protein
MCNEMEFWSAILIPAMAAMPGSKAHKAPVALFKSRIGFKAI